MVMKMPKVPGRMKAPGRVKVDSSNCPLPETGPIRIRRIQAGTGRVLANKTLDVMVKFAKESAHNPSFRFWVGCALFPSGATTSEPETTRPLIDRIVAWVRTHLRYIGDPATSEWVQTPEITLAMRGGDCDDLSVLIAAMAHAVGIPARFISISKDGENFVHVFPELWDGKTWINADVVGFANMNEYPHYIIKPVV
jgi:hypothetical protein